QLQQNPLRFLSPICARSKAVCGFLNAEGGKLLIGVDDQGTVLGLDADMRTLGSKGNRDGYELFLRQHLDSTLSILTVGTVRINFESQAGADVCVVTIAASAKPVFAKPLEGSGTPSEFWVRMGNATKQIHGVDMVEYQSEHWG
ncbi:MAG: ATP-binding protein, partial [Acidimicrobiaceae bacterium]|nr:ATP-binding protein [Acidimicrobiaceae bacterium]